MNDTFLLVAMVTIGLGLAETLTSQVWGPRWVDRQITALPAGLSGVAQRVVGAVVAVVVVAVVFPGAWPVPVAAGGLAWLTVLSVQTDLASSRIPREPCHAVALVGLGMCLLAWPGPAGWLNLGMAFLVCVVVPFAAAAFMRGGLGLGDVRLLWAWVGSAGWWLGFVPLAWALIGAALISLILRPVAVKLDWGTVTTATPAWVNNGPEDGTAGTDGTVRQTGKPRRHVPFAPSLAAGLVLAASYAMVSGVNACSSMQGTILSC